MIPPFGEVLCRLIPGEGYSRVASLMHAHKYGSSVVLSKYLMGDERRASASASSMRTLSIRFGLFNRQYNTARIAVAVVSDPANLQSSAIIAGNDWVRPYIADQQ
jgi:hypothetical protein